MQNEEVKSRRLPPIRFIILHSTFFIFLYGDHDVTAA